MSFKPEDFLLPEVVSLLRHFIDSNNGNEILAVGAVNQDGFVYDAVLFGMGDSEKVPAVLAAAKPGNVLIHNHPGGDIRPSDADLSVASRAAEKGIGSYIVDNLVTKIFPIVRWIPQEKEEIVATAPEEMEAIFGPQGFLSAAYSDYEFRAPQLEMSLRVTAMVNTGGLLAVEAGTGTGKSFSYLVPLMSHIAKNPGRKAVITTSTIALEEQLSHKDIPFLQEKLGFEKIPTAILKGRNNYLCLRKFRLFRLAGSQLTINPEKQGTSAAETVSAIEEWLQLPHDGSRTSLATAIDQEIWSEIGSDEHSCERAKCRHFDKCFFYKARRKANFASILLVNHHLLMADVSLRMEGEEMAGILPKYDILVIDEAHNLIKSAVSFLGESASTYSILYNLRRLFNGERGTGLLIRLFDAYANPDSAKDIEGLISEVSAFIPYYTHSLLPEFMSTVKDNGEAYIELDREEAREDMLDGFVKVPQFLTNTCERLTPILKKISGRIEKDPLKRTAEEDALNSIVTEINGVISRMDTTVEFLNSFFTSPHSEESVFWGEKTSRSHMKFNLTPLKIQDILAKQIYDKVRTIIFTSATLSTGRTEEGFGFFKRESGLELSKRTTELIHLPGCFDYASHLKAFIASDMPDPNSPDFEKTSISALSELVKSSGGGALVLFTSIRHRDEAKKAMKDFPLPLISQNDYSLSAVIDKFRKDVNSSLLATDTFWEGIDMKGDTLRNLIIVRLPFRFPSHPYFKRYVENLEAETGKDGFVLFTLPNAILKFKQGIGRLIRTKNDRGVITVLDKRLVSKSYGKIFIEALPEDVKFTGLPTKMIAGKTATFFSEK